MKKKILLVTIFDNINFGTYLQALATAIKINELGGDVEILRYEREHNRNRVPMEDTFKCLRYMRPLYHKFRHNKTYIQKSNCRDFVRRFVNITKLFYTLPELKSNPPKADVYLTGSDQVWNTFHNKGIEPIYYLDFIPDDKKRIAFSASIGMDEIDLTYQTETKRLLSKYQAISVRESHAVSLLAKIGIQAQKVVDPTILLNREEWEKCATPFQNDKPYVLVYSVEWGTIDETISKTARLAANILGGEVIEVNYTGNKKQIPDCDKRFCYATAETFLSLILGASFAVISSFHGTAFSLNLKIPFITVAPERFSSRIDSILTQTGTMGRKISIFNKQRVEEIIKSPIDFNHVQTIINAERESSLSFIKKHVLQ